MNKNVRYYAGIVCLIIAVVLDIIFVTVPFFGLKGTQIVSLMTVVAIAAECIFVLSIILLGKEVLNKIKEKFKAFFSRSSHEVVFISRKRHTFGLWLFFLNLLSYPITEIALLFGSPAPGEHLIFFFILLLGDLIFVISLFVLGEPFWDKVKNLFAYNEDAVEKTTDNIKQV